MTFVAMLTKLVERFDPYQYRVRENAPSAAGPFEHETSELVRQVILLELLTGIGKG